MIKLIMGNVFTVARSDNPLELEILHEALSYTVQNLDMIRSHNKRLRGWDGKKSFFDRKNSCFLTGFIWSLIQVFKARGIVPEVVDARVRPEIPENIDWENILYGITLRHYQIKALKDFFRTGRGVLQLGTGAGKCLAKGTKVLMFDGTTKNVEDVRVGDLLMGDDSKPRRVLSLAHGFEEMFQVTPVKGEPYTVNKSHILSLRITGGSDKHIPHVSKHLRNRFDENGTIDISVEEYLELPKRSKHLLKGYRVGVEFPEKPVPIDPYFLGVWLGDGRSNGPIVCTPDREIIDYLYELANSIDHFVTKYPEPSLADSYNVGTPRGKSNKLKDTMRALNLIENKHIPYEYRANSRDVRLNVLAGLIDTDGSFAKGYYEVTFKIRRLAEDTAYIARSLGLAAYLSEKIVNGSTYYRISISGHIGMIPVRVDRKRASQRLQIKDVLVTGIKVESVGMGEYFGFEIDRNRRFLLGDFTVTHNTELAIAISKGLGLPTLFLTHKKHLLHQTYRRFVKRLPEMKHLIGIIGDSIYEPNLITIATVQTLDAIFRAQDDLNDYRKAKYTPEKIEAEKAKIQAKKILSRADQDALKAYDKLLRIDATSEITEERYKLLVAHLDEIRVLIPDEAHRSGAKQFYRPAIYCQNAYFRPALTATPFMKGNQRDDMYLMGVAGPIVARVPIKQLIEEGVLARPLFKFLDIHEPNNLAGESGEVAYVNGIVHNEFRNSIVCAWAHEMSSRMGKKTLVIVSRKEHGKIIEAMMHDRGMRAKYLDGDNTQSERDKALAMFERDRLDVIVVTNIFDEGVDCDVIGGVVMAAGNKSAPALYQRSGRAMRKKDEDNWCLVIDLIDHFHPKLFDNSMTRYRLVEAEEAFTILQ